MTDRHDPLEHDPRLANLTVVAGLAAAGRAARRVAAAFARMGHAVTEAMVGSERLRALLVDAEDRRRRDLALVLAQPGRPWRNSNDGPDDDGHPTRREV
jgi:hypothetical protein